jgi:hypothetical protein
MPQSLEEIAIFILHIMILFLLLRSFVVVSNTTSESMPQSLEEIAIFILHIMIMFLFSRKRFFSPGFCCALLAAPLSVQLEKV